MSVQKATIGLFGGSFDPIHFGHINLAVSLKEHHGLEEVWLCPAQASPFKDQKTVTAAEHRLAMLELVVADIPEFKLCTAELERPAPSYTIETIRALMEDEARQLALIVGEDNLQHFSRWKDYREIVEKVPLLTGSRAAGLLDPHLPVTIADTIRVGITDIPRMDISSTTVRQRLAVGQYCGHLVPEKVIGYIQRHRLYKDLD